MALVIRHFLLSMRCGGMIDVRQPFLCAYASHCIEVQYRSAVPPVACQPGRQRVGKTLLNAKLWLLLEPVGSDVPGALQAGGPRPRAQQVHCPRVRPSSGFAQLSALPPGSPPRQPRVRPSSALPPGSPPASHCPRVPPGAPIPSSLFTCFTTARSGQPSPGGRISALQVATNRLDRQKHLVSKPQAS